MSDPAIRKDQMRSTAAKRRKELFAAHPDAGETLAAHVMASAAVLGLGDAPRIVSAFWPMGAEIDMRPLLSAVAGAGHITALPVVERKNAPLIFRAWKPGDGLVDGGFGTSIPVPEAKTVMPEVLFVPLLAYDEEGFRLGYGGGFYDRTLERLRGQSDEITAIGVAFSGQRVDTVPRGPYDQPLDWVASEAGLMRIGAQGVS